MKLERLMILIAKDTDGTYIAHNDDVYTHGIGATPVEAVTDFLEALESLYAEHLADEARLAPHLQRELDYLRSIFSGSKAS